MSESKFRALCAELLGAVDTLYKQSVTTPYSQTIELDGVLHPIPIGKDILAQDAIYAYLMDSARAALATPPPEAPTDEKLDDLWDEVAGYYALYEEAREFGRRAWELGQ